MSDDDVLHYCCNQDLVDMLNGIIDKLSEVDKMPIGKSFWVNDLAKRNGKVVWWSGSAWVAL
jgi:hypothetical protein